MYVAIPFMQPFHSSPGDYRRYTKEGLKNLFTHHGFRVTNIEPVAGPASSFVWISVEFFATLLSFGAEKIYTLLTIFFMLLLWPIKFLDMIFVKFPFSGNAASIFYIIAQKNGTK